MIKAIVNTEKYCENCPNFSAEHEQNNYFVAGETYDSYVIITCKYKDHCKNLIEYLNKV